MNKVAALIGNGASIAYNPQLSIPSLTEAFVGAFENNVGPGSGEPLRGLAQTIRDDDSFGFEELLGPLGTTLDNLVEVQVLISRIAEPLRDDGLPAAAARVRNFVSELQRRGLGTILHQIAEASYGVGAGRLEQVYGQLMARMEQVAPSPGDRTVATLNYDGLSSAAALNRFGKRNVTDLADGREQAHIDVVEGVRLAGCPIRSFDDLLEDRTAVLNLHGSLAWLSNGEETYKFELNQLREHRYWEKLALGYAADWLPKVVLTDRKGRTTGEWPFELAYRIFQRRLEAASHWLIVGYGFGDDPLNLLLKEAFLRRERNGYSTSMLVADYGSEPQIRERVRHHLEAGSSADGFNILSAGLPDDFDRDLAWNRWVEGNAVPF